MPKEIHHLFDHLPEITDRSEQGAICRVLVSQLRPTQNAVGFDEIVEKQKKIRKKTEKPDDLQDYLMQQAIPVIIGNGGEFYQIDNHHLARSVWNELGDMDMPVEAVKHWSVIEGDSFWKAMRKNKWLYPFAGDGSGPLPPKKLKTHVKDLENDIFRSLSWVVRQKYGYVKSPGNAIFAEFKWANFYRSRIIFDVQLKEQLDIEELTLEKVKDEDKGDYQELLDYAMYLATSDEAKGLPGYRG